jgi:hypothetical protein
MAKRSVESVSAEDAWAHTPEMVQRHQRARGQRGYVLDPDDLEKIAADAEVAHRDGREYRVSEAELEAMEARRLVARKGRPFHLVKRRGLE